MEVLNQPEMVQLQRGDFFKTIQVKGKTGMTMPQHHSTKEAVIVVQEGKALLKFPETDHILKKGFTLVIPAGTEHTLTIINDFTAVVIMAIDSKINFH